MPLPTIRSMTPSNSGQEVETTFSIGDGPHKGGCGNHSKKRACRFGSKATGAGRAAMKPQRSGISSEESP